MGFNVVHVEDVPGLAKPTSAGNNVISATADIDARGASADECGMRLFHFSQANNIEVFTPQAAQTQALRGPEDAWLNKPLVWAIDEWHQPLYLFPPDCPRIFVWPVETTTPQYLAAFKKMTSRRMVAHIEHSWLDRLSRMTIYRYELSPEMFKPLNEAGMWVSHVPSMPLGVERIDSIEKALEEADVELRVLPSLKTLAPMWDTSLHVSGISLGKVLD
jgi:hypothetical protein